MITSNVLNIISILSDVHIGRIRIPDFQRSSVWNSDDIELLLDSIYKGYPLGSFLLWETNLRIKERNPLNIPHFQDRPEREYLIDGQQRTLALYGVFKDQLSLGDEPNSTQYRAYFDLINEKFSVFKKVDIERDPSIITSNRIALHDALLFDLDGRNVRPNPEIVIRLMEEKDITKNLNFDKFIRNFTNYIVSGIIVQGVDLPEACEIFVRMNKAGVELNIVDLMVARTYSDEPYFNLRASLEEFNSEKSNYGYDLKNETILQCISACLEKGITGYDILQSASENRIMDTWDFCIDSLNRSIDYLKQRIVPISKYLPNDIILAPITYFYYNDSRPNATQEENLEKFFWNVSISQRYIQGQSGKIKTDIDLMQSIIDGNDIPNISHTINIDEVLNQPLRFSSSFCKSILCLLSTHNPLDLRTNTPVDFINPFSTANEKQYHHIFPKNYLKRSRERGDFPSSIDPYIDSIANICILTALSNNVIRDRSPSEYMSELESSNNRFNEALRSHLINESAYERILENDFLGFVNIRARTIQEKLSQKLNYSFD